MNGVVASLIPVFAVILIGYGLRRARFVDPRFWPAAERTTFYIFFPALLASNTANAELAGLQIAEMTAALLGAIVLVVVLTALFRRVRPLDGPAFSSLVQSAIRPNVYVAIAAAVAVFGADGLTAISVCVAIVVPAVNVISVYALVRYGVEPGSSPSRGGEWLRIVSRIASNPLILACALGLLLNAGGLGLPPLVGPLLEILGRASLPMGLLAVGAGLDLRALRAAGAGVLAASALKLIVLPLATWLLAVALGLTGVSAGAVVVMACVPVSATAYVMARQMGGDAAALAGAIAATTLGAMLTMPLILSLVT